MQTEFLYKIKPKLGNQFNAAEKNGCPLCVVIGEDEMAQGKVKIKEMGLRDGHPEKEGVMVSLDDLVPEVRKRIQRKSNLEELVQEAAGLRVVGGIRGKPESDPESQPKPEPEAANNPEGGVETEKPAEEKPAEASSATPEATPAVPAS